MMVNVRGVLFGVLMCCVCGAEAQDLMHSDIADLATNSPVATIKGDEREFPLMESDAEADISYKPEVYGAVKAKFELSTYDGKHRFNVRNSRIGVRGLVSPHMRYVAQIDFNNEGKVSILDSYVTYFSKNFQVTLGQQQYKFSTDLDRGPSSSIFSNRSALAKFLTTYFGTEVQDGKVVPYVKSIGSRDIGVLAHYMIDTEVPMRLTFGIFNGSGSNNPEWTDNVNFIGRFDIGGPQGLSGSVSHYNGRTPVETRVETNPAGELVNVDFKQQLRMWGTELRYGQKNYKIEAEYAQRRLADTELAVLHAAHVFGYYQFHLPNRSVIEYIAPIARWDIGTDIEFLNGLTQQIDSFSANRMTVGVNFGFVRKLIGAELRVSYENYFIEHEPSDYKVNQLLQDKFTIEVVASF